MTKTAVITGAGSGFGLETARLAAQRGMNLVLVDVQADALEKAAAEFSNVEVLARVVDVAKAAPMEALAADVQARFGAPHFVFNNAGVGSGGLIWENAASDWDWVMGVNVMGVVHGVRLFAPMMLAAAKADPGYAGHIVNTASMAGLLVPPMSGVYNVSKAAVVALSETLHHDLALVTSQVHASVLCPFYVPTGISQSHRNRPSDLAGARATQSQLVAQAQTDKAVSSGKLTAADVAAMVFDAVDHHKFWIFSHPKALAGVQTRMEDAMLMRNPTDPYAARPEIGAALKASLQG